jgi:transporter family protein
MGNTIFGFPSWLIFAVMSALFAALTAIFAKAGLRNINPDLATAIRTAIILVITWAIVFFKKNNTDLVSLSRNNWIFLILSAVATGLSWLFYYRALQLGKVSEVSVIDKGSLLFTVLLSFIFLKEPLTPKLICGIGLVFAGMLVVIWK